MTHRKRIKSYSARKQESNQKRKEKKKGEKKKEKTNPCALKTVVRCIQKKPGMTNS